MPWKVSDNIKIEPKNRLVPVPGTKERITQKRVTLPETNIAPENRPLEKEIPIGKHYF